MKMVMDKGADINTFNILLSNVGGSVGSQGILKLWDVLKRSKSNIRPTLFTYNRTLRLLAQLDDIVLIKRFWEDMKTQNIDPDGVTYRTLLQFFSKHNIFNYETRRLSQLIRFKEVIGHEKEIDNFMESKGFETLRKQIAAYPFPRSIRNQQ